MSTNFCSVKVIFTTLFTTAQSQINKFDSCYRLDISTHGGGILLYVRVGIPSILLSRIYFKENFETMFLKYL